MVQQQQSPEAQYQPNQWCCGELVTGEEQEAPPVLTSIQGGDRGSEKGGLLLAFVWMLC